VEITLAAIEPTLPALPTPTPTLTTVRVTGLPPESLSCLTAVFLRAGTTVERLPVPTEGTIIGPEADEVLLEGDPTGTCPWKTYWTPNSRLTVGDGVAEFSFLRINP